MGLDWKFTHHRSPSDPELTQTLNPVTDNLIEIDTTTPENWNPFSPYYTVKEGDFVADPSQCDDDLDFASLRDNLPRQNCDRVDARGLDGATADIPPQDLDHSGVLSPGEIPQDVAANPFFQNPALVNVDVNSDSSGSRCDSPNILQRAVSPPLSPATADPFGAVPFSIQNNKQQKPAPVSSPDVFGAAPFDASNKDNKNKSSENTNKLKDEFSPFGTQFVRQEARENPGGESHKNPFDVDTFKSSEFVADSRSGINPPGFDNPALDSIDGKHDPFGSAPFNSGRLRDSNNDSANQQSPKRTRPTGDKPRRRLPQTPTQTAQSSTAVSRQKAEQTTVLNRPGRSTR